MAANAIQMVFTCKTKKNLTAFDKTVVSLSCADAVSAIFFALYGVARILHIKEIAGVNFVWYASIGLNFSVVASFNHIIFIALQRFFAVLFPLNIKSIITKCRFNLFLALTWFSAGLYGILSAVTRMDVLAVNSYVTLVSGVALIILYVGISYTTSKRDQICKNVRYQATRVRNRAVLIHSLLVTVGFVVCFYPFAITYLFISYDFTAVVVSDLLVMFNTFLDVIIYFYIRICRNYRENQVVERTMPVTLSVARADELLERTVKLESCQLELLTMAPEP